MQTIKQSEATAVRATVAILLVDDTDGKSEEPGLTPSITVRKAGSSTWTAATNAAIDRGNGRYELALTASEVNTLGVLEFRALGTGARTFNGIAQIVAYDPYDVGATGANMTSLLARLPAALVSGRIDASVGAMAANVLTATAIAADAITAAKIANGAIDAATFATDAIDANALAASAIAELPTAATITTAVVAGMAASPVGSVTGAVGSVTGGATAAGLTSATSALATAASVSSLPSAAAIAAAVLGATLEAGVTVADGVRLLLSVNLGRRIIIGTTQTFRSLGNTKDRIVATVYGDGTRTAASVADGT